jgi:fructoselysine-6-phosphate deglycase
MLNDTDTALLNFDEDRFRSIQGGAVALAGPLRDTVVSLLQGGARNLFFLGAGGAGVLMLPAAQLLQRSCGFPVHLLKAAEVMATGWRGLGRDSLVVIPSLSGSTSESIDMLGFSQERGATVIALTGDGDSPVAKAADHNFTNFAQDDTSSESFYLQSLWIALALLDHLDGGDRFDAVAHELQSLPEALIGVKRAFEPRAADIAERIKDETYHVITGAGSTWAQAWYYGTCILEEMQWIRTRPIHSADFFHGTLELVEPGVSVMIFKGEDDARPLTERVEAFVPRVTDGSIVIDAAAFELPGISTATRALISPVLLATALERLSAHLEVLRDHPLTTRRYYKRVAY